MEILQRAFLNEKKQRKAERLWKALRNSLGFCIAKPALAFNPAPNVERFSRFQLRYPNFRQMCSQSSFVTLHPELFQVKSKCQEEQFCAHILLPSGEKTTEAEVILEQPKSAFHLNGTA